MINRALISVYKKDNILEFSKFLIEKNVEIISTGGTYRYLKENGIPVTEVSEITKFKEMLDGRVKTLHPNIHGGILAVRDNAEHMRTIEENDIKPIDMVIVNLYPFFEEVKTDKSFEEKVEFIDIGDVAIAFFCSFDVADIVNTKTQAFGQVVKAMQFQLFQLAHPL